MNDIVTGVAIKYDGKVYSLPRPNRHHNVIRHIREVTGHGISGPDVQGFITLRGVFLNRRQGMELAAATDNSTAERVRISTKVQTFTRRIYGK